MTDSTEIVKDLGAVRFIRNNRAKYLRIRIVPLEGTKIRITLPGHLSKKDALYFLDKKKGWILKHLERVNSIENTRTVFTPSSHFSTKDHQLKITRTDEEIVKWRVSKGLIHVYIPKDIDITENRIQKIICEAIESALKIEAHHYLPPRVASWAKKRGFTFNNLRFGAAKTRWGSCSSSNNINLNAHLLRLPEHLIDYVILHELCHTVHKNHSSLFWGLLEKVCPNALKSDLEMKNYKTDLSLARKDLTKK